MGDGKPNIQDPGQSGKRRGGWFPGVPFAGSLAVTGPGSYLRRGAFSISAQLYGRHGSLRRVGNRDLPTPVAKQTKSKEVI